MFPDVVEIIVPLLPPSVNHYVKHTRNGRHYVTKEAAAFKDAVALFSKGQQIRLEAYYIEIWFNLGKGVKLDLDNAPKLVLDGLVAAGVIHSDAAVTDLTLHKRRNWKQESTQITIWQPASDVVRQAKKLLEGA
jgi:crossover junction endodeoxyribonuclease RusA